MQQLLQQAMHYMQLEQFGEALTTCRNIIASGNNHPQVHMMMAIAYGQTGNQEKSAEIFNHLIQQFPTNPEIFYNYGLILQKNNDSKAALLQYEKCISLNSSHSSALNNAGNIALNDCLYENSVTYFTQAIKSQPSNVEYKKNLARAYYHLLLYPQCIELIFPILETDSATVDDFIMVIDSFYKTREQLLASKTSKIALEQFPNNAEILNLAGLIETDNKKFRIANQHLLKAIDSNPKNIEYRVNQLTALSHFNVNNDSLLKTLNRLFVMFGKKAFLYEYAASLCENLSLKNPAKKFIKKGLSKYPTNYKLMFTKAKLLAQNKKYSKAIKWLNNAYELTTENQLKLDISYEKSRVLDKSNRYKKAWGEMANANNLNRQSLIVTNPERKFIQQASESAKDFKNNYRPLNDNHMMTAEEDLIFIIGFPRSGTTLIEKILSSHPEIQVLEETNAINILYQEIQDLSSNSFFENLSGLSLPQKEKFKKIYINNIHDYIDWNGTNAIVDKMPMNGNHLALIKQIFPFAKIVFTIRHPIDVCLSCLMQNMLQVFTFKSAAKVYDAYMEIVTMYNSQLELNMYSMKYENLITNSNKEIKSLLEYLSIDWHDNLTKFYNIKTLGSTPSYQQVNQPIYQQAMYRFKNYSRFIQNEADILKKWAIHFNYHN